MALVDELAENLAERALTASKEQQDRTIIEKVSKALGDSSQTMQEAFLTAVRLRMAAERGHATLDAILKGKEVNNLDNPDL